MALINCPECGKEMSDKAERCPNCGYVLHETVRTTPFSIKKMIIALFIIAAIGGGAFAVISNINSLSGKEKNAYEIVVKCAENFKDPSSLRIVSGSFGKDTSVLACKIRAKNSFGAYTTGNYMFYPDGSIYEMSFDSYSFSTTDDFDIDKVNAALERHYN